MAKVVEELDVPKTVAAETVDAFLKVTTDLLKAGDKVTFPGFGTLDIAQRAARKGRNPQTGAEIQIAPHLKAVNLRLARTSGSYQITLHNKRINLNAWSC